MKSIETCLIKFIKSIFQIQCLIYGGTTKEEMINQLI